MTQPVETWLISGATGYLGSALMISRERALRLIPIRRMQRAKTKENTDKLGVTWSRRPRDLLLETENYDLDGIIHLAARYSKTNDLRYLNDMLESSISLTATLLEVALQRDIPLVAATTRFVGGNGLPPLNNYAIFKKLQEQLLCDFSTRGAKVQSLEIGDVYGPNDERGKVLPAMTQSLAQGRWFPLQSGSNLIYPVHVSDAVSAIHNLLRGKEPLATLSSIPGRHGGVTVAECRKILLRHASELGIQIAGPKHDASIVYSSSSDHPSANTYKPRASPPAGWIPRVGIEEGLRDLLERAYQDER